METNVGPWASVRAGDYESGISQGTKKKKKQIFVYFVLYRFLFLYYGRIFVKYLWNDQYGDILSYLSVGVSRWSWQWCKCVILKTCERKIIKHVCIVSLNKGSDIHNIL